mmetsp:Transcript_16937/g.50770  ORF Transcript_16937/g.50770 Transcript_16937/m.50770 type:complete len:229 (+) Transcript_16937:84-770(+)
MLHQSINYIQFSSQFIRAKVPGIRRSVWQALHVWSPFRRHAQATLQRQRRCHHLDRLHLLHDLVCGGLPWRSCLQLCSCHAVVQVERLRDAHKRVLHQLVHTNRPDSDDASRAARRVVRQRQRVVHRAAPRRNPFAKSSLVRQRQRHIANAAAGGRRGATAAVYQAAMKRAAADAAAPAAAPALAAACDAAAAAANAVHVTVRAQGLCFEVRACAREGAGRSAAPSAS